MYVCISHTHSLPLAHSHALILSLFPIHAHSLFQALSVLALQPALHDAISLPTGQLSAGADIVTPLL